MSGRLVLTAKGFRPFFLLAGAFGALVVPLWLLVFTGRVSVGGPLPFVTWHAHEMIFGFTTAVIAGFLLTAVGNWTQRETLVGGGLAALAALWLSARVALLVLPGWLGSVLDLAFLPALAVVLAIPLAASGNRRNAAFPLLLLALAATNLAVHLDGHGVLPGAAPAAHRVAVHLVVVVVLAITGRIVPMFTRNATGAPVFSDPRADRAALVLALAMAALQVVPAPGAVVATVGALGAGAVLWRARGWGARHTLGDPLLWVLHVGHAWVAAGLFLEGLAALGLVPVSLGIHALTVGAFGLLTLGMMARVALGHTGRPLRVPRPVAWAFALLLIGAVLRVLGPLVLPGWTFTWLVHSGVAWAVAFLVFAVVYLPVLLGPRADGKEG